MLSKEKEFIFEHLKSSRQAGAQTAKQNVEEEARFALVDGKCQ